MYALYGMWHCCNLIAPLKFQLKEGVCYVSATSTSAYIPSSYHFTSYGLVHWPSFVVWPAAHLSPLAAACSLAGAAVAEPFRSGTFQPFVDKLFRLEFVWLYSIDLSSSLLLLDTRRITSLVNSTESVGWTLSADAFKPLHYS